MQAWARKSRAINPTHQLTICTTSTAYHIFSLSNGSYRHGKVTVCDFGTLSLSLGKIAL